MQMPLERMFTIVKQKESLKEQIAYLKEHELFGERMLAVAPANRDHQYYFLYAGVPACCVLTKENQLLDVLLQEKYCSLEGERYEYLNDTRMAAKSDVLAIVDLQLHTAEQMSGCMTAKLIGKIVWHREICDPINLSQEDMRMMREWEEKMKYWRRMHDSLE
ncbi:MAG: hypothetical protein ACI4HI_10025 [Lachnospiraceae bacterium]